MRNPKIKEDDADGGQIIYRVTRAERAFLKTFADRGGMRVNAMAKRLAIQGTVAPNPFPDFRPDPAVVKWLQAIGVAIFKIRDNGPSGLTPEQAIEWTEAVRKISDFVDAAVEERIKG